MKRRGGDSRPRTIVVTGAGSGIGRAITELFLSRGWRVGAFDVDESALATLKEAVEAGRAGRGASDVVDRLMTRVLDVRDPPAWTDALAEFCGSAPADSMVVAGSPSPGDPGHRVPARGALDVLVNNAGILQGGRFVELPLEAQLRTVDVNLKGTLIGCHAAHPYLVRGASPQVINLCSASAIYGQAELATYSATKFAVRGLSEALDLEWRGEGIRVQAIWPLFVQTGMTDDLDIATTRALGVSLTPEGVARAVARAVARTRVLDGVLLIHRAVGGQARLSLASSSATPSWLLRQVNSRLARG